MLSLLIFFPLYYNTTRQKLRYLLLELTFAIFSLPRSKKSFRPSLQSYKVSYNSYIRHTLYFGCLMPLLSRVLKSSVFLPSRCTPGFRITSLVSNPSGSLPSLLVCLDFCLHSSLSHWSCDFWAFDLCLILTTILDGRYKSPSLGFYPGGLSISGSGHRRRFDILFGLFGKKKYWKNARQLGTWLVLTFQGLQHWLRLTNLELTFCFGWGLKSWFELTS